MFTVGLVFGRSVEGIELEGAGFGSVNKVVAGTGGDHYAGARLEVPGVSVDNHTG